MKYGVYRLVTVSDEFSSTICLNSVGDLFDSEQEAKERIRNILKKYRPTNKYTILPIYKLEG